MITNRDFAILCAVAKYYVLSRALIQRLCFPEDRTGRATRRRLQALVGAGLLNRTRAPVFNPQGGSAWPAYFPSRRGIELLAEHFENERFLAVPSRAPDPVHLLHWLAVSETHITLDQAIAMQQAVRLEEWFNEWDTLNPQECLPERRFRLYTLLRENPRLVCVPDAGFLLSIGPHRKVFYLEQDRATSGVRQVAASKTPGYAELLNRGGHLRHFPQATIPSFGVLAIVPTSPRREALRKAMAGKPGAELWRFAAQGDLTAQSFLHAPVFYPCHGDPAPLVKTSASSASSEAEHLTEGNPT